MATHVEEFFRTLNVHHLYQCSKEELSVLADRFEVTLTSRLKEDMQRELVVALTEKGLLNVEQQYVSENDEPNVKTNGSGERMEMSGSGDEEDREVWWW